MRMTVVEVVVLVLCLFVTVNSFKMSKVNPIIRPSSSGAEYAPVNTFDPLDLSSQPLNGIASDLDIDSKPSSSTLPPWLPSFSTAALG